MENSNQKQAIDDNISPHKYRTLAIIDLFIGIPLSTIQILMLFLTTSELISFYQKLNVDIKTNIATFYTLSLLLIILGVVNIFIATKLLLKSTKNKERYFKYAVISLIVAFILAGIFQAITIFSMVIPFYKTTTETSSQSFIPAFQPPSSTQTAEPSIFKFTSP